MNVIFQENASDANGGAMAVDSIDEVSIINNTFVGKHQVRKEMIYGRRWLLPRLSIPSLPTLVVRFCICGGWNIRVRKCCLQRLVQQCEQHIRQFWLFRDQQWQYG